ncbi:MAG TPA: alpha-amylase family glycosyl hydrolase [Candidatus Acidoferrales bacterium]|jgi:hypothetical protein|nr:alpha-amylase family glycosyl hydrolase [Candidatus Acidoferrales bacterium]
MVPAPATGFPLRRHPHLYEINTWAWLEQLSARAGRQIGLRNVPDSEWDSFARLGFDIVWLMGVWQRSPKSREVALADPRNMLPYKLALPDWSPSGVVGSPYAVKQYVPDTRIGTWDDMDAAREKMRARGMALFLDFVGNHTALDHPWTAEHPEFYVQGSAKDFENDPGGFFRADSNKGVVYLAYGRDPYFPPWMDVAQLNHFSLEMRAAEIGELRNIARHCDGVRCDMAMLHLRDIFGGIWGRFLGGMKAPQTEFWADAHCAVPRLVLLAEAYWGTEQRLLDLGFSFVYDKGLYDAVRDANAGEVRSRLSADVKQQSHFARFLENHDEARSVDLFGRQRLSSVATLMGTLPGMRFYYQGELEGCIPHLPITLRTQSEKPPDGFYVNIFEKILTITKHMVFHEGDWRLLDTSDAGDSSFGNLVVYEWLSATGSSSTLTHKVIAVNLRDTASQAWVHFGASLDGAEEYIFYDQLHDVRYPRKGSELLEHGLFVRLEGFQAHLFDVTRVSSSDEKKGKSNAS